MAALGTCCKEENHKRGAGWQRMSCSAGFNPENVKRRCKGKAVQTLLHPLALSQANSAGTARCRKTGCK